MGNLCGKSKVKGKVNYQFAIICHYITSFADFDRKKEIWEQYYDRYDSNDITPHQAQRLIKEHKLVLVVDNEYGKIWDRE